MRVGYFSPERGALPATAAALAPRAVRAALLTALIKKMPLEQAARFANRAAADCCTALGASAGVQSFEQTLSRL